MPQFVCGIAVRHPTLKMISNNWRMGSFSKVIVNYRDARDYQHHPQECLEDFPHDFRGRSFCPALLSFGAVGAGNTVSQCRESFKEACQNVHTPPLMMCCVFTRP